MNNKQIQRIALEQSAIDYGFNVEDFYKEGYVIHPRKELHNDARNYLKSVPFLNFIYYGNSLICIAHDDIKEFTESYVKKNENELYRVFDVPQINLLSLELKKHNMCIAHIADFYLPDVNYRPTLNNEITTKLFVGDEIKELYNDKRFEMALCYKRESDRRDELAIAAYINNEIVGVAGCSNDSKTMWQIGIDVVKEHRNQGIASTLTYLLSQEILKRGIVPFYCTAYSNIASRNTARKAGFRSAWVELTAKSLNEEWITNIIQK